jgi:hypothetical protein
VTEPLSKAEFEHILGIEEDGYRETIRRLHAWALAAKACGRSSPWSLEWHMAIKSESDARDALPKDWWE